MPRPAVSPGRLLERSGDAAPRGMIAHDRTRLIGRLRHFCCRPAPASAPKFWLSAKFRTLGYCSQPPLAPLALVAPASVVGQPCPEPSPSCRANPGTPFSLGTGAMETVRFHRSSCRHSREGGAAGGLIEEVSSYRGLVRSFCGDLNALLPWRAPIKVSPAVARAGHPILALRSACVD